MNYLITAAGKGSRLISQGLKPPKPLVIVNGIELLIWSLSSFNFCSRDKLYIVTQKKDRVKECLLNKIKKIFPHVFILVEKFSKKPFTNDSIIINSSDEFTTTPMCCRI